MFSLQAQGLVPPSLGNSRSATKCVTHTPFLRRNSGSLMFYVGKEGLSCLVIFVYKHVCFCRAGLWLVDADNGGFPHRFLLLWLSHRCFCHAIELFTIRWHLQCCQDITTDGKTDRCGSCYMSLCAICFAAPLVAVRLNYKFVTKSCVFTDHFNQSNFHFCDNTNGLIYFKYIILMP